MLDDMSWNPIGSGHGRLLSPTGRWLGRTTERLVGSLARGLESLAFWTAVGLPLVYLPLVVDGLAGREWLALAILLVAHGVALIAGHGYGREEGA